MAFATFVLLLRARSAPFRRRLPAVSYAGVPFENEIASTLPTVELPEDSTVTEAPHQRLADGDHSVDFPDGTRFIGQWVDGKMNGRGVLQWPSGDHYEGEWVNGMQQGQGTFKAFDGSMYFGGWKNGLMEGLGVFKPAAPASFVYLRSYENGVLIKETSLRVGTKDGKRKKQQLKESKKRSSSSGAANRPLQPGEVIYKGHHSYDLMRQLQVGIMYSIAQAGQWSGTALTSADFTAESVQYFPAGSAADSPAFKWKDYAPRVFQSLRQLFGIDNADYLVSLTGGPALRELASPGASGCIFFLSSDDRFLIKSVRKEEMELLLDLVRQYHGHVAAQPGTLLARFYGVHRVSPWLGRNARFLVMGNVLPTDRRMHRKYDLKGSLYKRSVGEEKRKNNPGATLKDLDIDMQFEISADRRAALVAQITADAVFLESLHVIDYSLLLGVHFLGWGDSEWYPPFEDWPETEPAVGSPAVPLLPTSPSTAEQQDASTLLPPPEGGTTPAAAPAAAGGGGGEVSRKPIRSPSMAVGQSLVDALESLSSSGMLEPDLSATAASVVASANTCGLAARATALEASNRGQMVRAHPWMDSQERHQVPDLTTASSIALMATPTTSPPVDVGSSNTAATPYQRRKSVAGEDNRGSGWAVPAVAVRQTSSGEFSREPVLLYFGIIDFLQHYNARKWVEHAWKKTLHGPSVSVADPHYYAKRFVKFLEKIFVVEEEVGGLLDKGA